ncbi:MAG: acyl-CoA dehydrogenase family protein, partial [Acidimicrobiia bacterium]|nr:acyl-CoA dehydrogenase family protein [Acidimicrobiia bacterium]
MTGAAEFNEVFLDGARIPRDHLVGEVNGGWRLAVALMAHERAAIGRGHKSTTGRRSGRYPLPLDDLVGRARAQARLDDPMVRQDLARVHSGERIIDWLNRRSAHPSITKLWRSRQGRLAAQVAHELGGPNAAAWPAENDLDDYFAYHVLNCRGMSIGGGTDEIQRNTLGERVLGLPR